MICPELTPEILDPSPGPIGSSSLSYPFLSLPPPFLPLPSFPLRLTLIIFCPLLFLPHHQQVIASDSAQRPADHRKLVAPCPLPWYLICQSEN
ncbi:hypothetical protein SODALDRAFT_326378 [Sodiomyces alkalinus F11]|uniref:Uncharacterized protein n=1 Tax=Sodiomyces alkalinus (strain CBS 110278 / VKM F-3762 / F11) TaxID=1314773 RepID=A0A3N2Q5Z0_SODAK|nr:hypothetical protein SODALDRAFT_326378 [Sodiomyces alkalinus F11]ROT42199.1 hypothetical protein SODALDRAFT_326378 [Sodiomyces alkalinus F11]